MICLAVGGTQIGACLYYACLCDWPRAAIFAGCATASIATMFCK